jgi:hypothetical protein
MGPYGFNPVLGGATLTDSVSQWTRHTDTLLVFLSSPGSSFYLYFLSRLTWNLWCPIATLPFSIF